MTLRAPVPSLPNYNILGPLGEGGMGTVWLAEQPSIGRKVAVKELDRTLAAIPEFRERFRNEASALARLHHPGIVSLHDYVETPDGHAYLVMEYVQGQPLDDHIRNVTGPMPTPRLLELFAGLLTAFQYAHDKGVVHRDVKPGNIMVTPGGQPKILDFGIAKLADSPANMRLTRTGTRLGTVLYMSPEQVKGRACTAASDIYSLGVVLFEAATGRPAYDGEALSEFEVQTAIVNEPLPPPREFYVGVDANVAETIARATAKEPERRFETCTQMLAALRNAAGTASPKPSETPAPAKPESAAKGSAGAKPIQRPAAKRTNPPPQPVAASKPSQRRAAKQINPPPQPVAASKTTTSTLEGIVGCMAVVLLLLLGIGLVWVPYFWVWVGLALLIVILFAVAFKDMANGLVAILAVLAILYWFASSNDPNGAEPSPTQESEALAAERQREAERQRQAARRRQAERQAALARENRRRELANQITQLVYQRQDAEQNLQRAYNNLRNVQMHRRPEYGEQQDDRVTHAQDTINQWEMRLYDVKTNIERQTQELRRLGGWPSDVHMP